MSVEAPAPPAAAVEAPTEAFKAPRRGIAAMDAAAESIIETNAATSKIEAEHSQSVEAAQAALKAAKAEAKATKAAREATLAQEKADQASRLAEAREAAKAAQAEKKSAIDKKTVSPEVAKLNDTAELEIYGSKGRTYTDEAGNVIADAKNPVKGKLAEIRDNPKYGKTQPERDSAAEHYEKNLKELTATEVPYKVFKDAPVKLGEAHKAPLEVKEQGVRAGLGLEISQAKLVLDLREQDLEDEAKLTGRFIADGMDPKDAYHRATKLYDKKNEDRVKLIKENGVFSKEDYAKALKKQELYESGKPADAAKSADTTPKDGGTPPAKPREKGEFAKEFNSPYQDAKKAKQEGNWTEYQKSLLAMGELADASEADGSPVSEEFTDYVDSKLEQTSDGRIKRGKYESKIQDIPDIIEQTPVAKRKLRDRAKAAMLGIPLTGRFSKEHVNGSRNRKVALGLGALAAAGVGSWLVTRGVMTGDWNPFNGLNRAKDAHDATGGSRPTAADIARVRANSTSGNSLGLPSSANPNNLGAKGPGGNSMDLRSTQQVAETMSPTSDVIATPGGTGAGVGIEGFMNNIPRIQHLDGATSTTVGNKVTYTITEKWASGHDGPFDWALKIGVKPDKVRSFLTEVMGPDYSEKSKLIPTGGSVSTTLETIQKYSA